METVEELIPAVLESIDDWIRLVVDSRIKKGTFTYVTDIPLWELRIIPVEEVRTDDELCSHGTV